ncbi:MAG: polyprenyl synthetase family protein [Atopobiaceae bacterium]|jgi:geranylgeranyl diphosphate synthase type I|nr:polyprenyl synthetase family protein [Atopobiaceae bacterium]
MTDPRRTGSRFVSYLEKNRSVIDVYLQEHSPRVAEGDVQAEGLTHYLYAPLERFVTAGGKRTRPALVLLGCEAVGGKKRQALSTAAAIENFQSAALIHDDIADRSELRRGQPCVYRTEGTGVAINVGDLALTTVFSVVLDDQELPAPTKLQILSELIQMENMTLEGQALDLGWVRDERWDITPEDYLYMALHKTAYYSGSVPLATGAICGGGTQGQINALRAFGLQAGLAFQLQDDLLNLIGDAHKQGKDFRSDITEGKRTLIAVWSLSHLDTNERKELLSILQAHTGNAQQLERAVTLMEKSGSIEYVQREADRLASEAKEKLSQAEFNPAAYEVLLSMADFFVGRED